MSFAKGTTSPKWSPRSSGNLTVQELCVPIWCTNQTINKPSDPGDYQKISSFKGFPYKSTVTTPIHPQSPNETLEGWRNLEPRPIQSSYAPKKGLGSLVIWVDRLGAVTGLEFWAWSLGFKVE